jgi:hypothetical protein
MMHPNGVTIVVSSAVKKTPLVCSLKKRRILERKEEMPIPQLDG